MGLILIIPAIAYSLASIYASHSIKAFYEQIMDEYGKNEYESEAIIIEGETKKWLRRVSIDVAREIDLYLSTHPTLSTSLLAKDKAFRELALQPVVRRDYTAVVDLTTKTILVHPRNTLEGKSISNFTPHELADIIMDAETNRFIDFEYKDQDDVTKRYLFATPIPQKTKDGHSLMVVVTANMDDIAIIAEKRSQSPAIKRILKIIEDRQTAEIITATAIASLVTGLTLIIISIFLLRQGIRSLRELRHAATKIAGGTFDIVVKKFSNDEFGDVANAFNRMATLLKDTVISRNFYEDAKLTAEKALNLKTKFLANFSHEIRTPLNAIIGLSEVMIEDEMDSERKKYLTKICESGRQLLLMIENIIEISKLEAGKVEIGKEFVYLKELIWEVEATYKPIAEEKGIEFKIEINEQTSSTIETDRFRLKQLLTIITDNAVKYTPRGLVSLKVVPYFGDHSGTILFEIRDTGIGIPDNLLENIFTAFAFEDTDHRGSGKGSSLGLPIAAYLAKLLGGEMWVTSELGKGSTFSFTI